MKKIVMKQTINFLISLAQSGDEIAMTKIVEIQKEIVGEKEKYFILRNE